MYCVPLGDVDSISNCLDYKQSGNYAGKRGLKWLIGSNINFEEGKLKMTNEYKLLFLCKIRIKLTICKNVK